MRNNDTTIGEAYFKEDEGMHLNEFYNVEDKKAVKGYTKTARIAYLIVSNKESEQLNEDEKNKEKILENIKDKYTPYLIKAIKKESIVANRNITLNELQESQKIIIDKKIVNLNRAILYNTKSYGNILKTQKYDHAFNTKLEDRLKENKEEISVSVLSFDKNKCQKIINSELKKDEQAYVIVSLAYVYHIKEDSKNDELELVYYKDEATVSFMPELIVEYGVFFDGTNNNIHNIDFYRNFAEFLKEPIEYIEENKERKFPRKPIYQHNTIQDYIVSEPNPKLNDEVLKLIIKQIEKAPKEIRYFDKKSNLSIEEEEILNSTKANHGTKVFDFLIDIKNGKKGIEKRDIEEFVRKEILVDKNENSSYTNGESNISRLYNLYNANDVKRNKESLAPTRFKLYESGAGTKNPFIKEKYGDDEKYGLGLALGETGIKAHIIYSCIKIFEQLRASFISHIDELVLDVFGFSRGAATARHFVNTILEDCEIIENGNKKYSVKVKNGKNIFSSFFKNSYVSFNNKKFFNPLNTKDKSFNQGEDLVYNPYYGKKEITIDSLSFRFVGLYDTVPHFGFRQANDFRNLNLDFSKHKEKLGQVVHLMAEHEFRYNFDAFSIFTEENKDFYKVEGVSPSGGKKFEEYYLPGAHSDVGGGYNIKEELILLTKRRVTSHEISSIKTKIMAWNKKYNWVEKAVIEEVNSKKEISDKKDGFYYYIKQDNRTNYNISTLYVYMYKKKVSNRYEYVSLKLMHDRALYKDISRSLNSSNLKDDFQRVPLGSLGAYKFYKDETLDKAYETLKEKKDLKSTNIELYKKLKDSYLHHSSKLDFVNKPSYKNKERSDFYGKRVVYSALGREFTRG